MGVKLPSYLLLFYWSSQAAGVEIVGTIWIVGHYALMSLGASLRVAVYGAIGIRTLLLLRGHLKRIWEVSVPPYTVGSTLEPQQPITWEESLVPLSNKIYWFKIWMGISIAILPPIVFFYFKWIQWNSGYIVDVLDGVFSAEILFSLAYLLSAPVMTLLPEYTSEMNTISLVGTATLIWIPAIPLTLAFLNFNSLVHESMNRFLFEYVDDYFRG